MKLNEFKYNVKSTIYAFLCRIKYMFEKHKYVMPNVKSVNETISEFVKEGISCGRFGDGEIAIIYGQSISFQEFDQELANRLKEILSLDPEEKNFLVCIPSIFNGLDFCKKEARKYHLQQLVMNYKKWYESINCEREYYNAFSSRFYSLYKDKSHCAKTVELWKNVWENKRVLVIEGEYSRLGVGNSLFDNATEIKRILCPSKNAWSCYSKILENTLNLCGEIDLVLVALGPTATVLCYDLYKQGVKALDVGHIDIELEWFLMGTDTRVAVKGKFVNEVKDDGYIDYELNDGLYEKQIIMRIK